MTCNLSIFSNLLMPSAKIKSLILISVLATSVVSCGGAGGSGNGGIPPGPTIPPVTTVTTTGVSDALQTSLSSIRDEYGLPAVAGLLSYNNEVIFNGVDGKRSIGTDKDVTTRDVWHLGSITKSMTATLAARFVEKGLIQWGSRIRDIFPELVLEGNGQFDAVTLEQLLSHHAGLQRNIDWWAVSNSSEDLMIQRREVVSTALNTAAVNNGDDYYYSNLGFVVAGAMLEAVSGKSWETLMQEELFTPLAITDAGFGAPGDGDDQPQGHLAQGGSYNAMAPFQDGADNPAVIGPAGTVHMSLASLAKYASAHMLGAFGESSLLTSASFAHLHQPMSGSDYALGWFIQPDSIFHDGSNNLWYAKLGISVEQQIIVISVTNAGGEQANQATDKITNEMLRIYFEG
ncbi:MAG: serine hydrolase [Alteromonadaceae bacterium]|nr:serine hydrolase [Alteromonadaceae bacterium]